MAIMGGETRKSFFEEQLVANHVQNDEALGRDGNETY